MMVEVNVLVLVPFMLIMAGLFFCAGLNQRVPPKIINLYQPGAIDQETNGRMCQQIERQRARIIALERELSELYHANG